MTFYCQIDGFDHEDFFGNSSSGDIQVKNDQGDLKLTA